MCVTEREKMQGSTFQVSSLSPSEEEMLKLFLILNTIAERFTKQELQLIFDQTFAHYLTKSIKVMIEIKFQNIVFNK